MAVCWDCSNFMCHNSRTIIFLLINKRCDYRQ